MGSRDEYLRILAAHGRRVANRFAFAELRESGHVPTHAEFTEGEVAMYGPEGHLPVDERSRLDNSANAFDPLWWFKRYRPDWRKHEARKIDGSTKDWARELIGTTLSVLQCLILLLREDELFLAWMDTDEGSAWREFDDSLNSADLQALRILLIDESFPMPKPWPAPGSSEAEAWLQRRRIKE